jgi:serine/threonine protein kinase
MAPEQLDSRRADERSDIYSLGVLLFELLTGELPFSGETPMAIAAKHLNEAPRSPRLVAPAIPYWLERVILRCLEKDPSSRYWTANELLTELRRSRANSKFRRRTMSNGDIISEDLSGNREWQLLVSSDHEKSGWSSSIAVFYKDLFYKLRHARSPNRESVRWEYAFNLWPEKEIMRRVVDYESEVTMESARSSLFSKAKKWIG